MRHYLYHWVPKDMEGDILYPLNVLKEKYPNLYRKNVQKYEGREQITQIRVDILNCFWNDVLFLSPIYPRKVLQSIENAGFPKYKPSKWFKIPLDRLDISVMAVSMSLDRFLPMADVNFQEINFVPDAVKEYHRECFKEGNKPLMFAYLSQALYKGSIDTKGLDTIEV